MSGLQRFYTDIKNTFYNPLFYSHISQMSFLRAFWLFVKLSFVASFVLVASLVPYATLFVQDVERITLQEYFPSELEIVIEDGIASSNIAEEEPYYFNIPGVEAELLPAGRKNAVMVYTQEEITLSQIQKAEAFLILTSNSLVFKDDEEIRLYPYEKIFKERVVLNKENVERSVNAFKDKLPLALTLLGLFTFAFLTFATPLAWMLLALILSPIAITVNFFRKLGLRYKTVFILSMYALVPAITINIFSDILFGVSTMSFLITATIFTVVLVWNTTPAQEEPNGTPTQ